MIPERLRWLIEDGSPTVELAARFLEAGHALYLVGGSVRDALLDREVEDLDFTTEARPEEIRAVLTGWADSIFEVGEAFGTIGARKQDWFFEITTFRSEVYRYESRKPRVTFSNRIEDDLVRRDFTINSMALRLPATETIDPCGGLADLAAGLLRTPAAPEESFSDDPLRMLRMFRFQATLGFTPDSAALEAVRAMGDRLEIVSAERIRDEFSKLIMAEDPGPALAELVASGLSDRFMPELSRLAMEQDPVHKHKDVLAHTIAVVQKTSPRLRLRMAALLHDIGKPETRSFGEGVTFHHHEVVGARMARDRLRAMRYPNEFVSEVRQLVFLHLRPHTLKMGWTDSAVRRYVRDAGALLEDLNELVRCDVTTGNARRANAIQNRIDELEVRIAELRQQEAIESLRAPIDGNDVISYLGVEPGPMVGEVMDMLLDRRIDEGPYSVTEAYSMAREWALGKGLSDPGPPPPESEEE